MSGNTRSFVLSALLSALISCLTCAAAAQAQPSSAATPSKADNSTQKSAAQPQEVTFKSGDLKLYGYIWKPEGKGPFPAVLWNHGSEKNPGPEPDLGQFYVQNHYALFVPHRRGHGRSQGQHIMEALEGISGPERGKRMLELQDAELADVVNALAFLKSQPFVDPNRIAISGCSFGGIQTLLAGEKDLGIRALVPFAPAAMTWERNLLIAPRMKQAVDNAKVPIFELQAENDFSLGPTHELSAEAKAHHKDFQSKIYPPFGTTNIDGHAGFCMTATQVWGKDVLEFLDKKMNGKK